MDRLLNAGNNKFLLNRGRFKMCYEPLKRYKVQKKDRVSLEECGRVIPDKAPTAQFNMALARYEFAKLYAKDKVVLDLGCGDGYGTSYLSSVAKRVIGIDISRDAIQEAREKYRRHNLAYEVMDCYSLTFPDEHFDLVCSFEVIEHVDSCDRYLSEIRRVLKRNAVVVISTPNRNASAYSYSEHHLQHFNNIELQRLLDQYFKTITLFKQQYDSRAVKLEMSLINRLFVRLKRKLGIRRYLIPYRYRGILEKMLTGSSSDSTRVEDFPIREAGDDFKDAYGLIGVCKKTL